MSSSTILQQAGWLAAAKIVQGVASILATLAVARHLGPTRFGDLSLAVATASFVATAAALGLEQIATRELAIDRASPILPILRRLRVVGALMGSAVLLGVAMLPALRATGSPGLLLVLCLLPLAQVGDVAEWQLLAASQGRRIALVTTLVSPLAALLRLSLAFAGADTPAFAWTLLLEWSARSALLTLAARHVRATQVPSQIDFAERAISLLRDSMPLLLAGIAVFVYMRIDQFMIAAMLGTQQVGLYSAVVALAEIPLILPALLLRAALPTLTRQSAEDPRARDRTLVVLLRTGFYVHALVAVGLALLATPIVVLLYGDAYRAAAGAFRLQVLAAPFVSLGVLSSAWLVLEDCTTHALRRTVVGAVVNILLNLYLIPTYGIAGAAAATLVAQLIATYLADAGSAATRGLFRMKTVAMLPRLEDRP